MKIVIINASPRTDGLTATLLKGISDTLSDKNVDVSYYALGRLSMAQCLGCCACYKLGHCVIDDDAEKISCAIADADGLVLGTPTYASNVSGLMNVLIDRGHFVIEQLLMGKYCVTVATGENYGSKDAGKVLNRLVIYSGGRIPGKLVINAPFNIVTHDSNAIGKCRFLARRAGLGLYEAVIRKKRYPLQSLHHKIVFDLGIGLTKRIHEYVDSTPYSCSVGYSFSDDCKKTVDELLSESDAKMYAEKQLYYRENKITPRTVS